MQSLNSKLPPLKSIVAFEAAARHLSMTAAATELGISREAVSRQIRVLEEHLGVKLFDRLHRALSPTPAGRKFYCVVQESLENIADVAGAVRRPSRALKITVSATIAISSFWLTPRLAQFRAKHPDIEIHVAVSDAPKRLCRRWHRCWPALRKWALERRAGLTFVRHRFLSRVFATISRRGGAACRAFRLAKPHTHQP